MTASGDGAIGSRFGRYRIESLIGKGGMARVYRATLDGPLGFARPVAIKQIRADVEAHSDKLVRALVNEARLGARLSHPNVVDVLEFGEDEGAFFIVMEFVDGHPLDEVIARCTERGVNLPLKLVLQVVADVASGLAHAHALVDDEGHEIGLIHRDLKPANILISRAGQAMVADFGLAKSDANLFQSTNVEVKGTPSYMSPEQVACRPLTPASDLFSLGSILYELLSGEPLFSADNMLAIVHKVAQVPMDAEREWIRTNVPLVGDLFERLIAKDPVDRPASADQVAREVSELLRGFPAEATLADLMRWLDDETAVADSLPQSGDYTAPQPSDSGTIDSRPSASSATVEVPSASGTTMDMETRVYQPETETEVGPEDEPSVPDRPRRGWIALLALLAVAVVAVGIGWAVGSRQHTPVRDVPDEPATESAEAVTAGPRLGESPGSGEPPTAAEPDTPSVADDPVVAKMDPVQGLAPLVAAGGEPSTPAAGTDGAEVVSENADRVTVTIDCNPWCDAIHVDGDLWGESMQFQRPITAGTHEVRLHESKGGLKVLQVDVREEGTKVCWDFERGAPCGGT